MYNLISSTVNSRVSIFFFFFLKIDLFILVVVRGGVEGEKSSDSPPSMEPVLGSVPGPRNHDPSQNRVRLG